MATLIYVRRLAASTAALAIAVGDGPRPPAAAMRPFADAAETILSDAASSLLEGRAPAPFPAIGSIAMPDAEPAPIVQQRVVRIARQLKLMHASIARWVSPTSSG